MDTVFTVKEKKTLDEAINICFGFAMCLVGKSRNILVLASWIRLGRHDHSNKVTIRGSFPVLRRKAGEPGEETVDSTQGVHVGLEKRTQACVVIHLTRTLICKDLLGFPDSFIRICISIVNKARIKPCLNIE